MTRRTRRMAALLSTGALVAGAGIGVAQGATSNASSGAQGTGAGPQRQCSGPITSTQLDAIASKLGVSSAQLKSALDAARPARPADGPGHHGPDGLAGDLATALGVDQAKVASILKANRPKRPSTPPARGTRPPAPDKGKLAAALASGLGIDKAKVTAALDKLAATHRADDQARHAAMYAAVAKSLGVSAADVRSAFEAVLPSPPAH